LGQRGVDRFSDIFTLIMTSNNDAESNFFHMYALIA
jgi:hypothetical protein